MKFTLATRLQRTSLAVWKLLFSFRKRAWTFDDYPVHIVQQVDASNSSIRETIRTGSEFRADIVNWHGVHGLGSSPEAALENLREVFERKTNEDKPLPRPGRRVPVEVIFSETTRIDALSELADRLLHEVLGYEWAFISDDSTLWDFSTADSLDPWFEKIREVFHIDVSDITSGSLAEILERIAAESKLKEEPARKDGQ